MGKQKFKAGRFARVVGIGPLFMNLVLYSCPNPVDPNQVVFHPVWKNAGVAYPSHVKRFEVNMFAFAQDQDNLTKQVFFFFL